MMMLIIAVLALGGGIFLAERSRRAYWKDQPRLTPNDPPYR